DPKKSSGLLRQGDQIVPLAAFACVEREKANHSVVTLCRVLGVSTSGYYAWRTRKTSQRALEDEVLKARIMEIYVESRRTYGAPRMTAVLAREGWSCSRKRVARLINELGIAGISRRSEERRVGKECRSRWAPDHDKKKRGGRQMRAKRE